MTSARRKAKPQPAVEAQAPAPEAATIAPWPMVDRYPVVLGQQITGSYIASIFRLSQTGYRQQYVDLLDELLEREPHGYAVLAQRVLTVAGARVELVPAQTDNDRDEKRAKEICDPIDRAVNAIPDWQQSLARLAWALYYAVSALEISYRHGDALRWEPARLHFIHSRRLNYPDPSSWSVRIWDQGAVRFPGDAGGGAPTTQIFGIDVADYPGKFIVHQPSIRGDYPTREGLGRQLADLFAFKRMGLRSSAQYIERFSKPWVIAKYATGTDGKPRAAKDADILQAEAVVQAMGIGSLTGASLPDSINVELFGPGAGKAKSGMSPEQWIAILNGEISKVVKGQTFTTETGSFGSRSTADVGKTGEMQLARYDARCIADTLQRDLIDWLVKLNFPGEEHLTPRIQLHVDSEPDPMSVLELASRAAASGIAVDGDQIAEEIGLPVVEADEGDEPKPDADGKPAKKPKGRQMVPLSPVQIAAVQSLWRGEDVTPPAPSTPPGQPPQDDGADPAADTERPPPPESKKKPKQPTTNA